jgi:hypothetical protein
MASHGKLGGLATASRHDPNPSHEGSYTRKGLQAAHSLDRFLAQVDPDNTLSEEERLRRALAAKRLWHVQIGRKGGLANRKSRL